MRYVEAIESYMTYLRIARSASPKTCEQYELHLWKFLQFVDPKTTGNPDLPKHQSIFLGSSEDPQKRAEKTQGKILLRSLSHLDVESIKIDDLNEFRLFLTEKGLSVKSANAYMISFRSFFKFLKKK